MTVKQYTRLYFVTVIFFLGIAFWQQLKMASLHNMTKGAAANMSTGLDYAVHAKHDAQPADSVHAALSEATQTIQRYEQALQKLKTINPEAAKQFEDQLK